jgi:glycosyltransferase involved in cell wall biosynthesis
LELFHRLKIVKQGSYVLIRGSGVNTNRFLPSPSDSKNPPVLFFASRLLREKGLYELFAALRSLRKKNILFEFRCAGKADQGNPSAIRLDELEEWKREGLAIFLGHIDKVDAELKKADIVILPSWREGLPKILLEAASAGKAILTTDVPGCREVVEHGKSGWIVPVRDPSSLEEGLKILLLDHELRNQLGKAAREKAISEFDQEIIHKKTLQVYEELLSQA